MRSWDPWRGCHKISEGCLNCYIHVGDLKRSITTDAIIKTEQFDRPIRKNNKGTFLIPSNEMVYTCFRSDFLIEEADQWRAEAWQMMRERQDLSFLFLTKRIERFQLVAPHDFSENFRHVHVGCSIENQQNADRALSELVKLPIHHKLIICQPMLGPIDLSEYLSGGIELVVVGGESGRNARPLHHDWVLAIRDQCIKHRVSFELRQLGSITIKDGKTYKIPKNQLFANAKKADLNVMF